MNSAAESQVDLSTSEQLMSKMKRAISLLGPYFAGGGGCHQSLTQKRLVALRHVRALERRSQTVDGGP
jgi:hypothetical protein